MCNLFIVHTQYNLILAVGLSELEFREDENHLILFKDFNLTNVLVDKLKMKFNKVLVLDGCYPTENTSVIQKIYKIIKDNREIKSFMSDKYERIFIVEDMCIQEMYSLKCASNEKNAVEMLWLEDGSNAYFTNTTISKGMGATPFKRWIRKIVFSSMFNMWKYYDLGRCMGTHRLLTKAYLTFPYACREELTTKELCAVSDDSFKKGMEFLFKNKPIKFESGSLFIAMDKLSVYGDKLDEVNNMIREEIAKAKQEGRRVYYKYHPRETARLTALKDSIELDRTVALESYLINSTEQNLTVLGIMSTSLQTAKKMGYSVVSMIRHMDIYSDKITEFYNKIGIICK